jgi:hypothetical protein
MAGSIPEIRPINPANNVPKNYSPSNKFKSNTLVNINKLRLKTSDYPPITDSITASNKIETK